MKPITLDGNSLTIADLHRICKQAYLAALPSSPAYWEKIDQARDFLENYIAQGYPTYGVTTGFGDSCHNQISFKKSEALQKALIRFHGIGLGENFSPLEGKAITVLRLNSNAKGYSAVSRELLQTLLALINQNIVPVIPKIGSVGASGDLTPLSYLAAVLTGERKVYYQNQIIDAAQALKLSGIQPITLQAKEGLAIMNGTSVMTAVAALSWESARRLSFISDFLTAITAEILECKEVPFRAKVSEIKNHPGQLQSAQAISEIIKDSKRIHQYEEFLKKMDPLNDNHYKAHQQKIQDRYSVRCAPHINGVLKDTLIFTQKWIENEMNSANDNPLVDVENQCLYNTGNFYGGHISLACDYLRIALANISDLSEKQAEIIIDGKFNNLTENLIPFTQDTDFEKGLRHGFKAAQISISALCAEVQYLAGPVSIHSRPTESLNQDKVSMGTISARKLDEVIKLIYLQFAIHITAAAQAVDLVGAKNFSSFTQTVFQEIRKISPFVLDDRPLDQEITKVAQFLAETPLFDER